MRHRNALIALLGILYCLCLYSHSVVVVAVQAADAATTTATIVPVPSPSPSKNASGWWTEDLPYMYAYRYKRLPNGSIVLSEPPEDERFTIANIRKGIAAKRTALERFFMSGPNRRTAKEVKTWMLMNMVPPAAVGSVAKIARLKRLNDKRMNHFVLHNVVIPGAKLFGELIVGAIKKKYGGYIQRQIQMKRFASMSLEEMCAELGIRVPVYDAEAAEEARRPNYTLAYTPTGIVSHFLRSYVSSYVPYANYTQIYYSPDDDLPPPVLPAPTYPWPWRQQLAATRDAVLHVMALTADARAHELAQFQREVEDAKNDEGPAPEAFGARDGAGSPQSTPVVTAHRQLEVDNSSAASGAFDVDVNASTDAEMFSAAEEFDDRVSEYHFATGLPRLTRQNHTHVPFPTLASLLQQRVAGGNSYISNSSISSPNSSPNSSADGDSDVGVNHNSSSSGSGGLDATLDEPLDAGEAARRERKCVLHDAMVQLYAYPTADASHVKLPTAGGVIDTQSAGVTCNATAPCFVQSGVTVYTPELRSLFAAVVNTSTASEQQQRQTRLRALQRLFTTVFEAERAALAVGVQTPSTVWYALNDRDSDELADAVQGCVEAFWRNGDGNTPRDVYENLATSTRHSVLHTHASQYWRTLLDLTRMVNKAPQLLPSRVALDDRELSALLLTIVREMQELDVAIAAFIAARAADPEYIAAMDAAATRAEYTGSEFSTLGFGYQLPATNKRNVLVRDVRQPEPLHLVLRLLVRVQESRLLLPRESRHVLTCLAMVRRGIDYYRCR